MILTLLNQLPLSRLRNVQFRRTTFRRTFCARMSTQSGEQCRRICFRVQYDGSRMCGWEKQTNQRSVQGCIEDAARQAFQGFDGFPFQVQGSSRTDSGVHAVRSVAHLNLPQQIKIDGSRVALTLQKCLPPYIVILDSAAVPANDWDVRDIVTSRKYRYIVHNSRRPNAFLSSYVWHYYQDELDADMMNAAVQHLLGMSDLSAIARVERHRHLRQKRQQAASNVDSTTPLEHHFQDGEVKRQSVEKVRCWREGDFVVIEIQADRFLYGQVRMLVGALVAVGSKRISEEDFVALCQPGAPMGGRKCAPASGLYLFDVGLNPSPFQDEASFTPTSWPPFAQFDQLMSQNQ